MRRALLVAAATLGVATGLRAQQVVARVGGELSAPLYGTVRIPITVDMSASGGALLGSYTARLTWNPAVLGFSHYVSGGQQDSLAQGTFTPPSMNRDSANFGVLKFSAAAPSGVGGLVTIAQFQFYTGYDTLPSPVTLSFSEMSAAGTFANLLPFLTVEGATYCRARGLWGDLDRDGASNSRDALIVLSQVVGLFVDPQLADTAVADVDADGRTTSRDALVILSNAVGMPITGQRVLLPVPSSCGTGSATQVSIQPGTIELVVGQTFKLVPQATDSAGRPVAVPPVTWRSSDYAVSGIDGYGLVMPRAPGTATITAELGPGVSATATVTVIARRPTWFVDIAATGRTVQNGSAVFPFEAPAQAFALAAEGDTIRVAAGTYFWLDEIAVSRGVVLLGGTPGDTLTRPVFRGDDDDAFWLRGGQRFEVRNVVFADFSEVFDVDGVRNLILEDVKFLEGQYGMDGIYMCGSGGLDTLRIDRTHFLGDPVTPGYGDAIYIGGCSYLDVKVLLLRDSRIEHMGDAVYGYGVDSLQVLRTTIRDNRGDGIYLSQEYDETPAVHIAHSRIERNRYGAVTVYDARRIVIDSSVIRADSSEALTLGHDYTARGPTLLRGDSIYMGASYSNWLYVYRGELAVEDVVVRFPDNTSVSPSSSINADTAEFRRVTFLNVGGSGYSLLSVSANRLLVDSVTVAACAVAGCSGATAIDFAGSGPQPTARVLRSSFTGIDYPVQASTAGTVLEVRDVVADSVNTGVYAYNIDSVAVFNSTFTRASYMGIHVYGRSGARGPSLIAGTSITCTTPGYYQYGVYAYDTPVIVQHDTVTNCERGVDFSSVRSGSRIRQSTLRNNPIGVAITQYAPSDTVLVRVDSTAISGSATAAVSVYGMSAYNHNRIENNAGDGLSISWAYGAVTQAHDNAFVNNTGYALVATSDTVDASANWWGSASQPPTSPPNGVLGRIDTSNPLASAPANLPGLTPPSASVRVATASEPNPTAAPPSARRQRPDQRPVSESEVRRQQERETKRQAKAARAAENRAR